MIEVLIEIMWLLLLLGTCVFTIKYAPASAKKNIFFKQLRFFSVLMALRIIYLIINSLMTAFP